MNEPGIHSGYLVLADLTGFTTFVAGSELAHAQSILSNLLGVLRGRLTPALHLAEIEGDALFLFAPANRFVRGESLLELIETTYVAFRDTQRTMQRNAACPCEACRMIPGLDLKFVTHGGEYVLQRMTGVAKPFGSSVNAAHRLLKNDIVQNTGWPAYALFTEVALEMMGVRPDGMHTQPLEYPHLGTFAVSAIDLHSRYAQLTDQRSDYVADADAHFTLRRTYPLDRQQLWDLLTDPRFRNTWEIGADWSVTNRPRGRSGPGATNHCAASDFIEEVLDWRPFDYFTVMLRYGPLRLRSTCELTDVDHGTEIRWSIRLDSFLPPVLRGPACRFFATRLMRAPARFEKLDRMIADETARLAATT